MAQWPSGIIKSHETIRTMTDTNDERRIRMIKQATAASSSKREKGWSCESLEFCP